MCDRRFALLHPPAVVALVLMFAMAGSVADQTVAPAESPSRTPWGDPGSSGYVGLSHCHATGTA